MYIWAIYIYIFLESPTIHIMCLVQLVRAFYIRHLDLAILAPPGSSDAGRVSCLATTKHNPTNRHDVNYTGRLVD